MGAEAERVRGVMETDRLASRGLQRCILQGSWVLCKDVEGKYCGEDGSRVSVSDCVEFVCAGSAG
jgi:hypothetical protein